MPFEPFFPPSSGITRKVIRRIGERRASALGEEAGGVPDDFGGVTEGSELFESILDALESDAGSDAAADWKDQRWLSEVLYNFMGLRAGRIRRGTLDNALRVNHIVEGLHDGLGLYRTEDVPLLEELADEFWSWLKQNDGYVAGWGVIVVDGYDRDTVLIQPLEKHRAPRQAQEPMIKVVGGHARAAQEGITGNLDLMEK